MAEAVLSTNMMDQTADGLNQDLMDRLESDDRRSSSESNDDDRSSGEYGRRQDASQGCDPALAMASRGLSVIHRRKNFQLRQPDEQPQKGGNVSEWLAGQDFGRVFSQANMAQHSFSSKFWRQAQSGKPQHYTRHTQLRVVKGTYWDRFMSGLNWLDAVLPVFNPHTPGRRAWDVMVMAIVLYNAWSVPMEVSFGLPADPGIEAVSVAVDVIFGADILTNFRTAYVDKTGHLVKDTDRIALEYMKFWFWIDLFATIPYEEIVIAAAGNLSGDEVNALGFLRTPRLLRLGRIFRILDRLKAANVVRVASLMGAMILLAHWLACIWYMLFKFTTFVGFEEWAISMEGTLDVDNNVSVYISAYYQSFLLLLGEDLPAFNNVERVYMICILLGGAVLYSAVVSQMAVLVASMDLVGMRHRLRQGTTLDVLSYIGLNKENRKRVEEYFNYITHYSHPAGEGIAFLNELPKPLFEEVTGYAYRKHLQRVPLFFDLEEAFLMNLSLRMRMIMFIPRETIFRAGDLGLEMYIICKGSVAVIGRHNHMLGLLTVGQHFGEIALFTEAKRTANCVSMSNLDLCVLSAFDFKAVLKDFPHSAKTLKEAAMDKLRQFQVAGTAGVEEEDMEAETRLMQERMHARARKSAEKSEKPVTIKEISQQRRRSMVMDAKRDSMDGWADEGQPTDASSAGDDGTSSRSSPRKRKEMRVGRRSSAGAEETGKVGLVGADSVAELAGGGQGPGKRKGGNKRESSGNSSDDGASSMARMGLIDRKSSVGWQASDEEEDRPAAGKLSLMRKSSTGVDSSPTKAPIQRKSSSGLGRVHGGARGVQEHMRSNWHSGLPEGHQDENGLQRSHTRSSLQSGEPSGHPQQQQEPLEGGVAAGHVQGPRSSRGRRDLHLHSDSMKSTKSAASTKSTKSARGQSALHRRLEIMRAGALEESEDMQVVPKPRTIQRRQSAAVSFKGGPSVDLDDLVDDEKLTTAEDPSPSHHPTRPQDSSSEAESARASPAPSPTRPSPAPLTLSGPERYSSQSFATPIAPTAADGVRGLTGGFASQPRVSPLPPSSSMQGHARPDDDSAGPTPQSQDTPSSDQQSRGNGWPIGEGREHVPMLPPSGSATRTTTSRLASSSTRSQDAASTRHSSTRQPPQLVRDSESGSPTGQHLDFHAQRDHQHHHLQHQSSSTLDKVDDGFAPHPLPQIPPHHHSHQHDQQHQQQRNAQSTTDEEGGFVPPYQQHQRNASSPSKEDGGVVPPPLPPLPPHPAPPPAPPSAAAQSPLMHEQPQHCQHHQHPQQQQQSSISNSSEATAHPSPFAATLSHQNPSLPVPQTSNPLDRSPSQFAPLLPPQAPRSHQVTPRGTRNATHANATNGSNKHESVRPGPGGAKVPQGMSPRAMFSPRGPKSSVLSPRGSSPRWRPWPAPEAGVPSEGANPPWFRSIPSKNGSRTLLASPRGTPPSAFGAISASLPWGASSTVFQSHGSGRRGSLQRHGSTDALQGATRGESVPLKSLGSVNRGSMQQLRGSTDVQGVAGEEHATNGPEKRGSMQHRRSTNTQGGIGGEPAPKPHGSPLKRGSMQHRRSTDSQGVGAGGESTAMLRGSSHRGSLQGRGSTEAAGPAAVAAAEQAANTWLRASMLARRKRGSNDTSAAPDAAVGPGASVGKQGSTDGGSMRKRGSTDGGSMRKRSVDAPGGKGGGNVDGQSATSQGPHVGLQGEEGAGLPILTSNPLQQSSGRHIRRKSAVSSGPFSAMPSQRISTRLSNPLQQENSNNPNNSNPHSQSPEGQEGGGRGSGPRSSLPAPPQGRGRRGSVVMAAADIASKLFGGLGGPGAGQKEQQQQQPQEQHQPLNYDREQQQQQQQHEQSIACPKLQAKLRAAEQELDRLRDRDREVAALRAELAGMHKHAESDKPLHVMLYKQVKALLAAMEGLGSRVDGLDTQMSSMQGQILRLEASSNITSHGLLGKTLDDENLLPAPKLQQMRPKSASRRHQAGQNSGSFPPKNSNGNNSGSFQGQNNSLKMQAQDAARSTAHEIGSKVGGLVRSVGSMGSDPHVPQLFRGRHRSGTPPKDGSGKGYPEMGGAMPSGHPGSQSGGNEGGANATSPPRRRGSGKGFDIGQGDPGNAALQHSMSRGESPGSGPGLALNRTISRSRNNNKSFQAVTAPAKGILKQSSAMPAEDPAIKAEEHSAAVAAARPIKRMTSRAGASAASGSGSFR